MTRYIVNITFIFKYFHCRVDVSSQIRSKTIKKTFIDTHTPQGRQDSFLAAKTPTVATTSLKACQRCRRHPVLFRNSGRTKVFLVLPLVAALRPLLRIKLCLAYYRIPTPYIAIVDLKLCLKGKKNTMWNNYIINWENYETSKPHCLTCAATYGRVARRWFNSAGEEPIWDSRKERPGSPQCLAQTSLVYYNQANSAMTRRSDRPSNRRRRGRRPATGRRDEAPGSWLRPALSWNHYEQLSCCRIELGIGRHT